ncbi:hypothetical protein BS17DRAFT_716965 [Gyrodon lividus]|nr:hypothetical protein BS17DRAFT_716965 [Gyrodon lividus]
MSRGSVDEPLLPSSSLDKCRDGPSKSRTQSRRRSAFLAVSITLNVIFASAWVVSTYAIDQPRDYCESLSIRELEPQLDRLWNFLRAAPANYVVEWVSKRFNDIFDVSIYNGPPSPVVDAAWEALYTRGIMQLPKSEADQLPNKTAPIPGDEDNYIFTFDVFHQLHCLNNLRQALHPEYYDDAYYASKGLHNPRKVHHIEGLKAFDHMGHCIDSLRESLICSADTTPIVWAWDEQRKRTLPRLDVVHVCRDYGEVQEWADAHLIRSFFDPNVHL